MKAIKIDDTNSVLIDTGKGFNVWMDIYENEGEITADWNQYIFLLDNEEDVKKKEFQNNCDNYMEASEEAINFYELHKSLK